MNPLRSVGGRLTIALLLVVAGALGIAYLVVVPRLENRLVDARVAQLERDAYTIVNSAEVEVQSTFPEPPWPDFVARAQRTLNVSVAMYRPVGNGLTPLGFAGPRSLATRPGPAVRKLQATGKSSHATVTRGGKRYLEVAVAEPLNVSALFLVSSSLEDTLQTVTLVKRRLAYAGVIALVIALAIGFLAARMFAGRIRRLERAADRIAAGHFDQPVIDSGRDELGELAAAFERMRQRLAHLEHARREFIANASHELRTPLFALAGLLELLDDEELDDATRSEFLGTAREQSDRLTRLATDLLDLSRLDAGRMHVERETVELEELADVLQDEFRAVALAGNHALEVAGNPAAAVADEQRVLQVGRALVENALRHTPPGTGIRVVTRSADRRAILAVEDDGPGIPSEHLAHVFERFYRVNGGLMSGSGLGLAIAREVAELMGGELEIESRPGRTVLSLLLPAAALPARASAA